MLEKFWFCQFEDETGSRSQPLTVATTEGKEKAEKDLLNIQSLQIQQRTKEGKIKVQWNQEIKPYSKK